MADAARLDVVIGADIDRALSGFNTVERRMGTFSQTALGMFAGGMLQRGVDAFANMVTTGMGAAFDAVGEYEQRVMATENLVARELRGDDATLGQAESLALAGERAKELLGWTERLAIASPFDQAGVQTAFQMAMAYGLGSEEAQRLTQDTVDFAAGMGLGSQQIDRITRALGQMNQRGKVSGQELLQLTEAGFDANGVLEDMGVTIDDVSSGVVSSEKYIEMAMQMIERDFGGAAARSQETWQGLMNSLGDITDIGLRNLMTPVMDALKPIAVNVLGELNTPETMAMLAEFGAGIGQALGNGLEWVKGQYALGKNWLFEFLGLSDPGLDPTEGLLDPGRVEESLGLGDVFDAIKSFFGERSDELPGILEEWLVAGIEGLADAVTGWATDSEGRLGDIGYNVGAGVGSGVRAFFMSTDTSDGIADSVAAALANAAINMGDRAAELGGWIASRMVTGMVENLIGVDIPPWLTEFYGDMLAMNPLLNPAAPYEILRDVGALYSTPGGGAGTGPDTSWMAGNANMGALMVAQGSGGGMTMLPGGAGGDVILNYYNYGVHQGNQEEMRSMLEAAVVEILRNERAVVGSN